MPLLTVFAGRVLHYRDEGQADGTDNKDEVSKPSQITKEEFTQCVSQNDNLP